jgi:hypothetical protein
MITAEGTAVPSFSWASSLPLDGEPAPGREARAFLRQQLQTDGLSELADEVEAVASELLRDAVQRGSVPQTLHLDVRPSEVVVAVRDRGVSDGGQPPELVSRELTDSVPEYLTPGEWGWREVAGGREVWFSVRRDDSA